MRKLFSAHGFSIYPTMRAKCDDFPFVELWIWEQFTANFFQSRALCESFAGHMSACRIDGMANNWMGSVVSVKPIGRIEGHAARFGYAKNISLSLHDFIHIAANEKTASAEPRGRCECVFFYGKAICCSDGQTQWHLKLHTALTGQATSDYRWIILSF